MWLALGQDLSYPSELVSAGAELLQQLGQDRLGESTQVRVALPAGHPRTPAAAVNASFQLWQPNRTSRLTLPVFYSSLAAQSTIQGQLAAVLYLASSKNKALPASP